MINGDVAILYIKEIGTEDWFPIGCLTSNSMNEDIQGSINFGKSLNGWSNMRVGNQGYELPFSGLIVNEGTDYANLEYLKRKRTLIEWKFQLLQYEQRGNGYLIAIDNVNEDDNFINFSGAIKGYSEPYFFVANGYLNYDLNFDI